MIRPVTKFVCQILNRCAKLFANVRVIAKCSGYRGRVYIKLFCYVFYGNTAQNVALDIKYKEFANSNRLRNRLQMFYLNSGKIILLNLTSNAFVKEILLFSFLECVDGTQLI